MVLFFLNYQIFIYPRSSDIESQIRIRAKKFSGYYLTQISVILIFFNIFTFFNSLIQFILFSLMFDSIVGIKIFFSNYFVLLFIFLTVQSVFSLLLILIKNDKLKTILLLFLAMAFSVSVSIKKIINTEQNNITSIKENMLIAKQYDSNENNYDMFLVTKNENEQPTNILNESLLDSIFQNSTLIVINSIKNNSFDWIDVAKYPNSVINLSFNEKIIDKNNLNELYLFNYEDKNLSFENETILGRLLSLYNKYKKLNFNQLSQELEKKNEFLEPIQQT
ncbi:Uncharacterised protein [Mycoplasmopsis californica]|nr:Uncharacterised protein [Mycoplasmopsis californica]